MLAVNVLYIEVNMTREVTLDNSVFISDMDCLPLVK